MISVECSTINRPGVARADLKTPSSLISCFTDSVTRWSFSNKSSNNLHPKTVYARDLQFW